jgi:hypothetical protein
MAFSSAKIKPAFNFNDMIMAGKAGEIKMENGKTFKDLTAIIWPEGKAGDEPRQGQLPVNGQDLT